MIDASDDTTGDSEAATESSCPASTAGEASASKHKLTARDIVGSSVTFLLAGYETTANTLSYTSYLLAINPDIQEKLQSEIDSYFDDKPVSFIPCMTLLREHNNFIIVLVFNSGSYPV